MDHNSPGANGYVCADSDLLDHGSPDPDPTAGTDLDITRQVGAGANVHPISKNNIVINAAPCVKDDTSAKAGLGLYSRLRKNHRPGSKGSRGRHPSFGMDQRRQSVSEIF